jgi:MscS family membrane protein
MVLEQYIVNDYLRTLILLVVLFFFVRVVIFFAQRLVLRLSLKTKTDLDDQLVAVSSRPLSIIAFLLVLRFVITELTFDPLAFFVIANIIYSALVVVVAYLAYALIDVLIVRTIKKFTSKTKSQVDDTLVSLFSSVLKIALIIISFLYLLSLWGIEITPLLAGLGIAGLAVALALQPILSNIFSGASVVLDESVRVGDLIYLESEGVRGKIEKIGLRSSRVLTFDNEYIVIPNNKLAEGVIQNIAQPEPKSRVVVPFGVAYGNEIDKVKKVILAELYNIENVSKEPEPFIRFMEMADSSLNFNAYFYVDSYEHRASSVDEANTRIYNALNKAGIEIPFPQRDVNLKK